MSVSSKDNIKIRKNLKRNELSLLKTEKRDNSSEKPRKHFSLKNAFYNIEPKKKFNEDLVILNYITDKSDGRFSAKTALTNASPNKLDYDLTMINKYDENLNSLSCISDFDLEEDLKNNDSFNSCDNDDSCIEEIEIKTKANKNINNVNNNEFDIEFEKEWDVITQILLKKKTSH
jgi:hypothetical protein